MKKNFTYKFLISIFAFAILSSSVFCAEKTFVSLSPALTETMYAIGAQDLLKGVSTACDYPQDAKTKIKIGNNFFVNEEIILKIKPDYILAPDSSEVLLKKFEKLNIKLLCFKYPDINSIHQNILLLGKLTNRQKQAQKLVNFSSLKIKNSNLHHNHKILYLVQTSPMITIGKKSFINDVIEKSGNISVSSELNSFYPTVSEEYVIKQNPDVIVLGMYADTKRLKKIFPKTKIVFMTKDEINIINRPSPRIYKAVEFFSKL